MTGSTTKARRAAACGMGLVMILAALPVLAGDRSVNMIEGTDAPQAPVSPPDGTLPLAPLTTRNPAGVEVAILPDATLRVGTHIAFKVSTRQRGYLVLVDINAEGKVTQIYPNVMSLSRSSGNMAEANLIKSEAPVTIPNPKNPLARFTFSADLPRGNGAIVAILSDRPVQIIDLPDASPGQNTQATVDALYQSVLGLKIASSDDAGKFTQGTWSFAAVPYVIE